MEQDVSSQLENILTENIENLACRICFTVDNVQEAFLCSYNDQPVSEIVNILLSRVSSNNLEKLCMNCVKAVIKVHLFVQKLNDRKTFWEKTLSSFGMKSEQTFLLPTNNNDATLYDEKLLRIDEISIKNEENDDKNADHEHTDYELIIKDELVGLNDACEQIEDVPEYCDVVDDNHDYSIFDDEDDLPLIRLANMATPEATATSSIRVLKESSIASGDSNLQAKSITDGTSKSKDNTKPNTTKKLDERVLCKECGKMYSRGFIRRHKLLHTNLLQCDICGFSVYEKYKLANHAKLHDKVKEPLVCRFCDSVHDNLYDYKTHMKTHNVKRIFYRDLALNGDANECKVCGKTYALASSLCAHIRTHEKNTGTWCTYCQKGFSSMTLYRVHMRMHTGEKPYACPHCPMRFKAEWGMKVHVAGHDNKREYRCEFCPKTFNRKGSLNTHHRIHTDKTRECQFCSRQIRTSSFRKHIRTTHPETLVCQSTSGDKVEENNEDVVGESA